MTDGERQVKSRNGDRGPCQGEQRAWGSEAASCREEQWTRGEDRLCRWVARYLYPGHWTASLACKMRPLILPVTIKWMAGGRSYDNHRLLNKIQWSLWLPAEFLWRTRYVFSHPRSPRINRWPCTWWALNELLWNIIELNFQSSHILWKPPKMFYFNNSQFFHFSKLPGRNKTCFCSIMKALKNYLFNDFK